MLLDKIFKALTIQTKPSKILVDKLKSLYLSNDEMIKATIKQVFDYFIPKTVPLTSEIIDTTQNITYFSVHAILMLYFIFNTVSKPTTKFTIESITQSLFDTFKIQRYRTK